MEEIMLLLEELDKSNYDRVKDLLEKLVEETFNDGYNSGWADADSSQCTSN